MSLESFASEAEQTPDNKTRCKTCNLDPKLLQQIHDARERQPKPVSFPIISKWLKHEEGVDLLQATIRNHFTAGHHER